MFSIFTYNRLLIGLTSVLITVSCSKEPDKSNYVTENVIIIVVDGVRYSESWGDSLHENIPHLSSQLAQQGVTYTQFFNNGPTETTAGHTALLTGIYQRINNAGLEHPIRPSFLQYYNSQDSVKPNSSWIISSKYKLNVLRNCTKTSWKNRHTPAIDCGVEGLFQANRDDSTTFKKFLNILKEEQPNIAVVSFMEPDIWAHKEDWNNYINAIKNCDEFIYQTWEFIKANPAYKDKTTLLVTNDHGRHLDGISNGYISHGDNCDGCRHIGLYAFGPDFKSNLFIDTKRELIDIMPTIAELLNLQTDYNSGDVMFELFKQK